jgi:hypothetical protein
MVESVHEIVEPRGQCPWHLTNAQAGRHPGQKLAHSSTAKGRGFLLPGARDSASKDTSSHVLRVHYYEHLPKTYEKVG